GETLAARLARVGVLGPEASIPIIRQMAAALDAAHKAGVVHRDFKPSNVMLEMSGDELHASITDFGLSRLYESDSSLAETGRFSGTVGYIAPEVFQARVASPASDVYAFGVVLHEMLTGQKPQTKFGDFRIVRPSTLFEGLPRVWDRLILGCLEPDPARRFQSAGEAVAALELPSSHSRPFPPRMRRSRRQLLAWALAASLPAAGAI